MTPLSRGGPLDLQVLHGLCIVGASLLAIKKTVSANLPAYLGGAHA